MIIRNDLYEAFSAMCLVLLGLIVLTGLSSARVVVSLSLWS